MASGEGLDELGDISRPVGGAGMGPGRQRGQLQPGRPPLGARLERGHECGLQPQPHHLVEELLRFVGGEPEVRGPHLHELATRTQPRQRERRVGPSRHRQRDLWRQVVQQEGHRLMDGGSLDHVEVVERHHRGTGEDVEIIDQTDQDGIRRSGASGLQQGQRVDTGLGFGGLDRGHEMGQKPSEVGVARVESQPRHPALRVLGRRQPLNQERGLAEPSRCRDEDQPRPFASLRAQLVGEAGALHQPAARRGQVQLGAQHRHRASLGRCWLADMAAAGRSAVEHFATRSRAGGTPHGTAWGRGDPSSGNPRSSQVRSQPATSWSGVERSNGRRGSCRGCRRGPDRWVWRGRRAWSRSCCCRR